MDYDDSDDGTLSSQLVIIVSFKVDNDLLISNKSNSLMVMITIMITIII